MTRRFRVTGHFEASAPNDLKVTLNTIRPKVSHVCCINIPPSPKFYSVSFYDLSFPRYCYFFIFPLATMINFNLFFKMKFQNVKTKSQIVKTSVPNDLEITLITEVRCNPYMFYYAVRLATYNIYKIFANFRFPIHHNVKFIFEFSISDIQGVTIVWTVVGRNSKCFCFFFSIEKNHNCRMNSLLKTVHRMVPQ